MKYPNFNEEKKLWGQGYNYIVGLDESGRGPLAGPVVAAAVSMNFKFQKPNFKTISNFKFQIKDSKKLNKKQREEIYKILTKHPEIEWGIGVVSEKVIDKINILEATKLAMQRALIDLEATPDFLILDGNFRIKTAIPQRSIIRGDETVFSCTAAGIIAKVTRDRIMQKMHKKYPHYGFHQHKGYGTRLHMKNLKNFGPCKIHRKTFSPVSNLI